MTDPNKRLHTLMTDRACEGLDEDSEAELLYLLAGRLLDPTYEQAAAGIELAILPHDEPLPAQLAAGLLADAEQHALAFGPTTRRPVHPGPQPSWIGLRPAEPAATPAGRAVDEDTSPSIQVGTPTVKPTRPQRRSELALPAGPDESVAASGTGIIDRGPTPMAIWVAYASALASVVVLIISAWLFFQRREVEDDVASITAELESADDRSEWALVASADSAVGETAGGAIVWSSELQAGVLTLHGLAANQPTEAQYQLWIFDATRPGPPVDAGVFDVESEDEQSIVIDAKLLIGEPRSFTITVERPGGVVVSTQERVVMVAAAPGA